MTKDHANAIMFAYRYDNLTISESLFKQMIGDIAIMRNPWPIFSIAALSGAACLIYDHFFSYETSGIMNYMMKADGSFYRILLL